jgi:hypothetical protein
MAEKRGEAEATVKNKLILKKAVEHKTKQVLEKAFISEKEVYDLIRGFFKKYVNIEYEFTADELMKELRKVYLSPALQEKIKKLLERVSEMEHVSREFTRKELESILADFKSVVDEMIVVHYEKKHFFHKIRDALHGSVSQKHKHLLEDPSLLAEHERHIVKMNILLDNARRWVENDPEAAKKAYKELLGVYENLDEDKKKAYYQPVTELYNMIRAKN